jgi:flagellar biosynthesis protein FlhF
MSAMAERRAFRGESLEDALRQVREELGPDAIVVRQREGVIGGVGGFFGRRCVELEVETEGRPPDAVSQSGSLSAGSREPLASSDVWAEDSWAEPMPTTPRPMPARAAIDLYDSDEAPARRLPAPAALAAAPPLTAPAPAVAEPVAEPAAVVRWPMPDAATAPFSTPLDRYLSESEQRESATEELDAVVEPEPESPLVRTLYEQASPFANELAQAFVRTELDTLPVARPEPAVVSESPAVLADSLPERAVASESLVVAVPEPEQLPVLAEAIRVVAEPRPAPVFDPVGMERRLVTAGLDERLARDVVSEAESELRLFDPTEPFDRQVQSALARRIRVTRAGRRKARRVIALVGPAGSGKTLTAARLCYAYGSAGDRSVAALSLEPVREAFALAQHTKGLDIDLAVAADSTSLQLELRRLAPASLLVVDTPPVDPHDEDRLGFLALLLDLVGADETHLLMPASLGADAVRMLLDKVSPALGVDRLLLTHCDGPGRPSVAVAAAIRTKLPISFTATGQTWGLRPADAYELAGTVLR